MGVTEGSPSQESVPEPFEYDGDARERPLRITVGELNEVRNRTFHGCLLDDAYGHLDAALRFRGVLGYPEIQDEVEQEGQVIADDLERLIERYLAFRDRHKALSRERLDIYAGERTIYD